MIEQTFLYLNKNCLTCLGVQALLKIDNYNKFYYSKTIFRVEYGMFKYFSQFSAKS